MQSEAYEMNPSSAPYSHSLLNDNERYFNGSGKGDGGLMEAWDCGINKRDLTLELPSVFLGQNSTLLICENRSLSLLLSAK